MKTTRLNALALFACAAMSGVALSPAATMAQSQLDVSEAQAFLGKWVINMDTDMGPFSMQLEITEMSGKVAASVGAPEMGGMQDVSDITRSAESLVLKYEANGDDLAVGFDVADGMFLADGVATRTD